MTRYCGGPSMGAEELHEIMKCRVEIGFNILKGCVTLKCISVKEGGRTERLTLGGPHSGQTNLLQASGEGDIPT